MNEGCWCGGLWLKPAPHLHPITQTKPNHNLNMQWYQNDMNDPTIQCWICINFLIIYVNYVNKFEI